jgi:hypothetical protein
VLVLLAMAGVYLLWPLGLAGAALAYHSWRNRRRPSADVEDSRVPLLTTGRR